jgi:Holliday junction resolvase-like predicted endonuclease
MSNAKQSLGRWGEEQAARYLSKQGYEIVAQTFLQGHPAFEGDWRVDVIALVRRNGGAPEIRHFENAFS